MFLPFCTGTSRNVYYRITPTKGIWRNVPGDCRLVGINKTGPINDVNNTIKMMYKVPLENYMYLNQTIWIGAYEEYSPHIQLRGCFKDSLYIKNNAKVKYRYEGDIYNINVCINMCLRLNLTDQECKTLYINNNTCYTGKYLENLLPVRDPNCRHTRNNDGIRFTVGSPLDNCVCQYSVNRDPHYDFMYVSNGGRTQISRRLWGKPNSLTSYTCMTWNPYYRNAPTSSPCNIHYRFACEDGLTKWIPSTPSVTRVHTTESTVYAHTTVTMSTISPESKTVSEQQPIISTIEEHISLTTIKTSTENSEQKATSNKTTKRYTSSKDPRLSFSIDKTISQTLFPTIVSTKYNGRHYITKQEHESVSIPIISGIAGGCVFLVAFSVVVTVWYCKRKRRSRNKTTNPKFSNMTYNDSIINDNAPKQQFNPDPTYNHANEQTNSVANVKNKHEFDLNTSHHIKDNRKSASSLIHTKLKNVYIRDVDVQNNDTNDHFVSGVDKYSKYNYSSVTKEPSPYNDTYDHLDSGTCTDIVDVDATYGHGTIPTQRHTDDTYDHLGSETNINVISSTYDYGPITNQIQGDEIYDHLGADTIPISESTEYGKQIILERANDVYEYDYLDSNNLEKNKL